MGHGSEDVAAATRELFKAAREDDVEGARIALANGANIDARNFLRWTPLYHATLRGHSEVVLFLIDSGAKLDIIYDDGESILHRAVQSGSFQVVERLVYKGVDVKALMSGGKSPLLLALMRKDDPEQRKQITALLIRHGADVSGYMMRSIVSTSDIRDEILQLIKDMAPCDMSDA